MFITYGYNIYDNNGTQKGGGNGANVLQFTEIKSRLARINCDNLNLHIEEGNGNPLQYSCLENPMDGGAWQAAVHGVAKSQTRLSDFTFHFHALEKERFHFSLSCIGDGATSLFTFMHWRRKWQPTPVFLPEESQGWRSLVGCHLWGHTESDMTEATQQQQQ